MAAGTSRPCPRLAASRSKKNCFRMLGSSVVSGLAGHDHQRFGQVHLIAGSLHLAGSVESTMCNAGKPGCWPKVFAQHFGTQAGTAHAQQKNRLEAGALNVSAQAREGREILLLPLNNVDPAHPLLLAVASPQGRILFPEAVDFVVGLPVGSCCIHGATKIRGNCESEAHITLDSASIGQVAKQRLCKCSGGLAHLPELETPYYPARFRNYAVVTGQFGVMRIRSSRSPVPPTSSSTNSGEAAGTATIPRGGQIDRVKFRSRGPRGRQSPRSRSRKQVGESALAARAAQAFARQVADYGNPLHAKVLDINQHGAIRKLDRGAIFPARVVSFVASSDFSMCSSRGRP